MRCFAGLALIGASLLLTCGTAGAVIAGHPVAQGDDPAVVRLNGCTGTLITPTRILTAAHCARDVQPGSAHVKIAGASYRAVRVARDPRYAYEDHSLADPTPYAPPYDFALVELDRPVSGVQPLPLSTTPVAAGQRAPRSGTASPNTT